VFVCICVCVKFHFASRSQDRISNLFTDEQKNHKDGLIYFT
jgi:hypothetical protein